MWSARPSRERTSSRPIAASGASQASRRFSEVSGRNDLIIRRQGSIPRLLLRRARRASTKVRGFLAGTRRGPPSSAMWRRNRRRVGPRCVLPGEGHACTGRGRPPPLPSALRGSASRRMARSGRGRRAACEGTAAKAGWRGRIWRPSPGHRKRKTDLAARARISVRRRQRGSPVRWSR
jgi:hypothetical protein